MAINKNFVVKNGIQVGDSLIYGESSTSRVGIGTTFPLSTLDVRGTLETQNLSVSGISTLTTLNSTTTNATTLNATTGYINTGVVTTISGTTATYTNLNATNGYINTGIITNITGTGATYTNVSVGNSLSVTGKIFLNGSEVVAASSNLSGSTLTVSGIVTASGFNANGSTVPVNGMYLSSANNLSFATNTGERLRIDSTGQIEAVSSGGIGTPTYSFTADTNTGIYRAAEDQLAVTTGGAQRLLVTNSGINVTGVATATSFSGNLTGNVTGNITGSAGYATTAGIATVAQGLTGTPNLNVGVVTATSFVGNLTGNITGSAGYATTAGIATVAQGLTGTPNLNVGVVTATSFVGDGSGLTNVGPGFKRVLSVGVNTTLQNGDFCYVSTPEKVITLPDTPSIGNRVTINVGNFTSTIINRNGSNIQGLSENMAINIANASVDLLYLDAIQGWRII